MLPMRLLPPVGRSAADKCRRHRSDCRQHDLKLSRWFADRHQVAASRLPLSGADHARATPGSDRSRVEFLLGNPPCRDVLVSICRENIVAVSKARQAVEQCSCRCRQWDQMRFAVLGAIAFKLMVSPSISSQRNRPISSRLAPAQDQQLMRRAVREAKGLSTLPHGHQARHRSARGPCWFHFRAWVVRSLD